MYRRLCSSRASVLYEDVTCVLRVVGFSLRAVVVVFPWLGNLLPSQSKTRKKRATAGVVQAYPMYAPRGVRTGRISTKVNASGKSLQTPRHLHTTPRKKNSHRPSPNSVGAVVPICLLEVVVVFSLFCCCCKIQCERLILSIGGKQLVQYQHSIHPSAIYVCLRSAPTKKRSLHLSPSATYSYSSRLTNWYDYL